MSATLKRAFISFDRDIANDVLALFPGGIASLEHLSDDYIRSVINDYNNGLQNYKKVQLNMYGTTALLALVDPRQEHLWIANLGDCQAGASLSRGRKIATSLLITHLQCLPRGLRRGSGLANFSLRSTTARIRERWSV